VAVAPNPALDRVAVAPGAARGGTVRATEYEDTPGGKALHVALVAHELGAEVQLVAPLGGARGARVRALLEEEGVETVVTSMAAETRGTYTVVDPDVGDVLEVIEPAPLLTASECDQFLAAVEEAVANATIVAVSGSLASGIPNSFVATVIGMGRGVGALTLVDVHGAALSAALIASPDLVKPNLSEARSVTGRNVGVEASVGELADVATDIVARGARGVWLSLGHRGSILVEDGKVWKLESEPRPIVSAVGCGDALLGGLAAGLARGESQVEAARLGAAAATDKLSRAHPGRVDRNGVETALGCVSVTRIG
jgi:1-phosphofructokinase family hexose kinase